MRITLISQLHFYRIIAAWKRHGTAMAAVCKALEWLRCGNTEHFQCCRLRLHGVDCGWQIWEERP